MEPVARSRRTQSYSWSSDRSAIRPVYQWEEFESPSGAGRATSAYDDLNDEAPHQMSPSERDNSSATKVIKKVNYDSDSCLTPRSRRTLRRKVATDTEPWPSVTAPPEKPALDTIYSPTHEILHPMQSLMLEKSMSSATDKAPAITSSIGPTRRAMSVDFDSRRGADADAPAPAHKLKTNPFKFETYAFPEAPLREEDDREDDSSESTLKTQEDENENAGDEKASLSNVVVIIVNAEKKLAKLTALDWAINVAVQPGDEIVILGVLKHIFSPRHKLVANTNPLGSVKQELLQSEVKKTTELFEQRLTDSGRRAECEKKNLKLTVRIAPGARARTVVVRELTAMKATYAIFDRRIIRGKHYYGKHLSCHAVRMRSNGRSTKTVFTTTANSPDKTATELNSPHSTASSSPTSDASTSPSPSPTHFWRRFTSFRSSRNSRPATTISPRSSTASSDATADSLVVDSLDRNSFMSEMQDFSMSLDRTKIGTDSGSKLALQSFAVADAYSYKQGMDAHRIRHRPVSVTIPPLIAT